MYWWRAIAITLMVIGAINWGLIAFFQFDLVASIFGGQGAFLSRIIYGLVGLSGVYYVVSLFTLGDIQISQIDQPTRVNYGMEFSDLEVDDPTSKSVQTNETFHRPTSRGEE